MMGAKKEKMRGSTLCSLVHKNPETLASQDHDDLDGRRRRRVGLSASIFEFIKPRCPLWNTKKKKRPLTPPPHQPEKHQQILKSRSKLTLQEWIMNSPSLNIQFSGRIHPSFEESVEATVTNSSRPKHGFSLERVKVRMTDYGDKEEAEAEEDASIFCRRQNGKRKKKVSFRLPGVADIFILDSADGYYFSK